MDSTVTPAMTHTPPDQFTARLMRLLPLAGAAYAVLSIAGDLVIDKFPDENTPMAKLTSYYAAHHTQVGHGGQLMELSAIFLALFGVSLALRLRGTDPIAAAVIGVGAAIGCLANAYEGATFHFLGTHATEAQLTPQALQAWHMSAAAFGTTVPTLVLVLGLILAVRTLPPLLVWSAAVLGIAELTPVGFLAGMLMLLWFMIAGITLALRPTR